MDMNYGVRFFQPISDQLSREIQEFARSTGKICEKCGKPMVHRVKKPGKDGKGGYDFWGCTGWPECKG